MLGVYYFAVNSSVFQLNAICPEDFKWLWLWSIEIVVFRLGNFLILIISRAGNRMKPPGMHHVQLELKMTRKLNIVCAFVAISFEVLSYKVFSPHRSSILIVFTTSGVITLRQISTTLQKHLGKQGCVHRELPVLLVHSVLLVNKALWLHCAIVQPLTTSRDIITMASVK